MSTHTPTNLEEFLERAAAGKRDPEVTRKAVEELSRSREKTRKKIGAVDIAVDLLRDARDQ